MHWEKKQRRLLGSKLFNAKKIKLKKKREKNPIQIDIS